MKLEEIQNALIGKFLKVCDGMSHYTFQIKEVREIIVPRPAPQADLRIYAINHESNSVKPLDHTNYTAAIINRLIKNKKVVMERSQVAPYGDTFNVESFIELIDKYI